MLSRADILQFEEMNFNAWPALKAVHYDGWLLRCTGGDSRRVNSVNCIAPGSLPLAEKIATAEAIYARWGQRAVFRLTPLSEEPLDPLLIERGYSLDRPTWLQVADAAPFHVSHDVRIFERADDEWIDASLKIRGIEGTDALAFAAQHRAVGIEAAWVLIRHGEVPAAVGAVGIERGWAGLHGIYVASHARRRGLARLVSEALIGLAHARGARRVWLQVEQANAHALPLYASLGFQTSYSYHHRVQRT